MNFNNMRQAQAVGIGELVSFCYQKTPLVALLSFHVWLLIISPVIYQEDLFSLEPRSQGLSSSDGWERGC